jgi:DNA-binding MarR family transcriptional regulator
MNSAQRPIGYYLKLLDRRIEERFAADLAGEGIARRHWQVLNVLHAGPSGSDALAEALRPFWTESGIPLQAVLDDLADRGAVAREGDANGLTAAGRALRAAVLERVTATRNRLLDGLTAEDYTAVVETLQRMADNLGGGEAAPHQAAGAPAAG